MEVSGQPHAPEPFWMQWQREKFPMVVAVVVMM